MEEILESADVPEPYQCSISMMIMSDPVTTADGHSFDRVNIDRWFAMGNRTSPKTGAELATTEVKPNHSLRNSIEEWQLKHFNKIPRSALEITTPPVAHSTFKTVSRGLYRARSGTDPVTVAVLEVRQGDVGAEVKTLIKLNRHPRLVRYLGLCIVGDRQMIVTEFAPGGALKSALETIEDDVTPAHQLAMLVQIASGMEALAHAKMIHRDLALRNVLLFAFDKDDASRTSVKVSDFGLTVDMYAGTHRTVDGGAKPIRYMAPEALRRSKFSEKSDVWAFGVTAWELLSGGDDPYFRMASDDAVLEHVVGGGVLERPAACSDSAYDALWAIVTSCWANSPGGRPTFEELSSRLSGLGTPSPGPPRVDPVPASAGMAVDVAGVDATTLFVLRETGQLVTIGWLFANKYTKDDCVPVTTAAAEARAKLEAELQRTAPTVAAIDREITALTVQSASLDRVHREHSQNITSQLKATSEGVARAAEEQSTYLVRQFAEKKGEIASCIARRLADLTREKSTRAAAATRATEAIALDDVGVVQAQLEISRQLERFEPVEQLDNARLALTIPDFEFEETAAALKELVEKVGVEQRKPPKLLRYSTCAPRYAPDSAPPEPNTPIVVGSGVTFEMRPDVPPGLHFDTATGTISGTPEVVAYGEDGLAKIKRRVVAKNKRGTDELGITFTVLQRQLWVFGGYKATAPAASSPRRTGKEATKTSLRHDGMVWRVAPSMNSARTAFGVARLNGSLFAVGGHNGTGPVSTVERFDGIRWHKHKKKARLPHMATNRAGHAVIAMGDFIYAIGGHDGNAALNTVERFDGAEWVAMPPMSSHRNGHAAAVYGDSIVVSGGMGGGSTCNSTAERFDGVEWHPMPPMSGPRHAHAMVAFSGSVNEDTTSVLYAIGGSDGESVTTTVERWDGRAWAQGPRLRARRYGLTAMVVKHNGQNAVCAVGGKGNDSIERLEGQEWKISDPISDAADFSFTSAGASPVAVLPIAARGARWASASAMF